MRIGFWDLLENELIRIKAIILAITQSSVHRGGEEGLKYLGL